MGRTRYYRLIAARDLVLALRPGLDRLQAMIDRPFDRAIVTELEVQEGQVINTAPISAVKGVGADDVERAGDRSPVAACKEQQKSVAHRRRDSVEEVARQIGP